MPDRLIIIGGGEHARVVAEIARSRAGRWDLVGFVDNQPAPETCSRLGLRQFDSDDEALAQADCYFVLGIARPGSCDLRRRIVASYERSGARWACLVHASAWISETAVLAAGVVVSAGVSVNTGARVGAHCVINTGSIVEHDVEIGEFTLVAPGSAIGGGTVIGTDGYLGLGCRIRDHVTIGRGVTIGMGAVVVGSLTDGVTAAGVPATPQPAKGSMPSLDSSRAQ